MDPKRCLPLSHWLALALLLAGVQCSKRPQVAVSPVVDEHLSKMVERLTGNHARLVWCQMSVAGRADAFVTSKRLILRGLDTRDGRGDRVILEKPGNYSRALLSTDGTKILFTDKGVRREGETKFFDPKMYSTDWRGSEPVELGKGYSVDCWTDPATSVEWVYAVEELIPNEGTTLPSRRLIRFPLTAPEKRELVFDERPINPDNIQLSRTGKWTCIQAPWPKSGVLKRDSAGGMHFDLVDHGCWTSISPDDSGVFWVLNGDHRSVSVHQAGGERDWKLELAPADWLPKQELYHPRWSNHPRFVTFSGPYTEPPGRGRGTIIMEGGATSEIYIGKLREDAAKVEEVLKITLNGSGDAYPDLWIAGAEAVNLKPRAPKGEK